MKKAECFSSGGLPLLERTSRNTLGVSFDLWWTHRECSEIKVSSVGIPCLWVCSRQTQTSFLLPRTEFTNRSPGSSLPGILAWAPWDNRTSGAAHCPRVYYALRFCGLSPEVSTEFTGRFRKCSYQSFTLYCAVLTVCPWIVDTIQMSCVVAQC